MAIRVVPQEFTMVLFDAAEIATIAERLRVETGLPDEPEIVVEVDERSPTGRVTIVSAEPLHVTVESGALENPKKLRMLSEDNVVDVLGLVFFQAADRLDPNFGAPSPDDEISLAHRVAWDAAAMGRMERLGYRAQRPRRLYHFRNRHGFTDEADAAFDSLWSARPATWAELVAVSDALVAARTAATA
jgi:hypothetical protein